MDIVRTAEEIARVENWASKGIEEGSTCPWQSYEQGIIDTLEWLQRNESPAPDEQD